MRPCKILHLLENLCGFCNFNLINHEITDFIFLCDSAFMYTLNSDNEGINPPKKRKKIKKKYRFIWLLLCLFHRLGFFDICKRGTTIILWTWHIFLFSEGCESHTYAHGIYAYLRCLRNESYGFENKIPCEMVQILFRGATIIFKS